MIVTGRELRRGVDVERRVIWAQNVTSIGERPVVWEAEDGYFGTGLSCFALYHEVGGRISVYR